MTPEQVLSYKPKILSQGQREAYFRDGFILLEKFLSDDWVEKLRAVTEEMVERSRKVAKSDAVWDLEKGHTASAPRLRRLTSPNDHHPLFWEYAANSPLTDAIEDLVGPDVKFYHSKLNFKWSKGGEEVKWHQDIPAWPHTNYSPLTAGTYVYDCGREQGPLAIIPGSHEGPIYEEFNDDGKWIGCLRPEDAAKVDVSKAVYLDGPAGSITLHNCRALHYSAANNSEIARPLLLNVYSSADAFPYVPSPIRSRYEGKIVRGKPARWSHVDPRPCPIPPDWSGGYSSIFAVQQEEKWGEAKRPAGMM
jgi:ectoine hydroxylase